MTLPDWIKPRDYSCLDRALIKASYRIDQDTRPKYIYALIDPRNGEIRYVGKSVRPVERLANHMNEPPTNCHRSHWLKKLKSLELKPTIEILETIYDDWPKAMQI